MVVTRRQQFGSLGTLKLSGDGEIWYLDNDRDLPYICSAGHFFYFAFDGKLYNLVMESSRDLGAK